MISPNTKDAAVAAPPLCGLFATGRSGSTWLGAMLDAHPRVAYRFEPLNRLKRNAAVIDLVARLRDGRFTDDDADALYDQLLRADPMTDKRPFFAKQDTFVFGMDIAWRMARVAPPLRPLYAATYTPRDRRSVIFKEVTQEPAMAALLESTNVPIVYLMRHPCGTVASLVRGQSQGTMPTGRLGVIDNLLTDHGGDTAARFAGKTQAMDNVQRNALLWRMDVEKAVSAIDLAGRGLLVTYEQLCDQPLAEIEHVFAAFNLDCPKAARDFLRKLRAGKTDPVDAKDPYFTIMRDPAAEKDRWRQRFAAEDIAKVRDIVADSFAFERGAALGGWTFDA